MAERNSTSVLVHSDVEATTSAIFKNNWTAIVPPNPLTDHSGAGYLVGSEYVDIVANVAYKCLDDTVGAGVWSNISAGAQGLSSVLGISNTTANGQIITALNGGGLLNLRDGGDDIVHLGNDVTYAKNGVWIDGTYTAIYVENWASAIEAFETLTAGEYALNMYTNDAIILLADDQAGVFIPNQSGLFMRDCSVNSYSNNGVGTGICGMLLADSVLVTAGVTRSLALAGSNQQMKTSNAAYVNKLAFNEGEVFETILDYTTATQENLQTLQNKSGIIALTTDTNGMYSQTSNSATLTNTLVETSIVGTGEGSLLVAANIFKVGDSFHAKIGGLISCQNADIVTIRIKSGATVLATTGAISLSAATVNGWEAELDFTITSIGVSGNVNTNGNFSYNRDSGSLEGFVFQDSGTINTTVSNTLSITAEWGQVKTQDQIYSANFVLFKVY